ncbi:alkaline phosphatase family protein [Thermodesulfobacteriota bacterium]
MHIPNYNDGSIVNLSSSIMKAFGGRSPYKTLQSLDHSVLQESRNIMLMVIDGLGYDFVMEYGRDSFFHDYLKDRITSVFPATTASAITSLLTGLAPQQHAVTGWFVYLKELGMISEILPFKPRVGSNSFVGMGVKPEDIFLHRSIFEKIKVQSYIVTGSDIINSAYNSYYGKRATKLPYKTLRGFLRQAKRAVRASSRRKFILTYWPGFDSLCHKFGPSSKKAKAHFKELDRIVGDFSHSLQGTDTTLIVTADHGFLDNDKAASILLKDHPDLGESLTLPLSGDARTIICYVHPDRVDQFEGYIEDNLSHVCDIHRSEALVERGLFGLGEPHPKLLERIGDYILIMRGGAVMRDVLKGEKWKKHKGDHSGVSSQEMYVPLIIWH